MTDVFKLFYELKMILRNSLSLLKKKIIYLTDMIRNIENGLTLIEKWFRNKNTIEFVGIWEEMYNLFYPPEFEGIKNEVGLNKFVMSIK